MTTTTLCCVEFPKSTDLIYNAAKLAVTHTELVTGTAIPRSTVHKPGHDAC